MRREVPIYTVLLHPYDEMRREVPIYTLLLYPYDEYIAFHAHLSNQWANTHIIIIMATYFNAMSDYKKF